MHACACVLQTKHDIFFQKVFLLKLMVNLLSPSFPERELLVHCAVENQAMKKRMGRWGGAVGGNKPSQNLHPLCVNEMVGGEAAKSSPGGGVVGRVAWDSQQAL